MDFSLDVREHGGRTVVAVRGEVDVHTAPRIDESVDRLVVEGARRIVVDLSGVTFLDSTGLGALVAGLNSARRAGGSLALAGPPERVGKLLRMTGLDDVFEVRSTVDELLAKPDAAG